MSSTLNSDFLSTNSQMNRNNIFISLDIVIPIFNEEDVLPELFERLQTVFSIENLKTNKIRSVKYLIIDDGSKDKSSEIVSSYINKGLPINLYRFTRNFGHQNAVTAGLDNSSADVVSVIDADLQDPPEVIFQMIYKWREGFDVVYGERKNRKENFIKRTAFWIFYRLLSYLSEIDIPFDSGDFSLMDKKVIKSICALPEKIRYPRVLRAWVGFSQTGVVYDRSSRKAGKPKYTFFKYYKLATDGVASSSVLPLRISQLLSIIYLLMLLFLTIFLIYKYNNYILIEASIRTLSDEIALWFISCFALISFGGFVQALLLYIMSAYIGRGYIETKGRPPYILLETITKTSSLEEKNYE